MILPTKDYYELSAFFANIDEAGLISYFTEETPTPAMPVATAEQRDALDKAQQKIDDAEAALERIRSEPASASQIKLPGPVAHVTFDGELPDLEGNTQVEGHVGKALHLTGDDPFTVPEVGRFPREQPFSASLDQSLGDHGTRQSHEPVRRRRRRRSPGLRVTPLGRETHGLAHPFLARQCHPYSG